MEKYFIASLIILSILFGLFLMKNYCVSNNNYYSTSFNKKEVKSNIITLKEIINKQNVKHPNVVIAQIVLSTDWFKSDIFKNYNNLFSTFDIKLRDYDKYNKWSDCIIDYKLVFQSTYEELDSSTEDDYLTFIGYSKYKEYDPFYLYKLKDTLNKLRENKLL